MNRFIRFDVHGQRLSRGQIRAAAALAFTLRNRQRLDVVREPDPGETPLSQEEICFAMRHGLVATRSLPVHGDDAP